MSQIFSFKMATKATLMVILLLVVVFAPACRRKQQDKPPKTPPSPVSQKHKSPENYTSTLAVKTNDQNVVAAPGAAKKETVAAAPQAEAQAVANAPEEPKKTEQPTPTHAENELIAMAPEEPQTTEQPPTTQPEETTFSGPVDLNSFESIESPEKKIDFISKAASTNPGLLPALIDMALDEEDAGVRAAAIDELAKKGFYSPDIIPLVEKAMGDPDSAIRQKALEACSYITDPAISDVLVMALEDESEDVRATAIRLAAQKAPSVRLPVLETGITSQYKDVKGIAAAELMRTSSPDAMDILITALNDPDPEFHYTVKTSISFLVGQEFETYEQAKQWWDTNRSKFGDDLKPINVTTEKP